MDYLIQDVNTSEYFSGLSYKGEPLFTHSDQDTKVFDSHTKAHAWSRTLMQETTRKLVVVYNT